LFLIFIKIEDKFQNIDRNTSSMFRKTVSAADRFFSIEADPIAIEGIIPSIENPFQNIEGDFQNIDREFQNIEEMRFFLKNISVDVFIVVVFVSF
jgi:hypothetical protein